jgi:hypothetical protein
VGFHVGSGLGRLTSKEGVQWVRRFDRNLTLRLGGVLVG